MSFLQIETDAIYVVVALLVSVRVRRELVASGPRSVQIAVRRLCCAPGLEQEHLHKGYLQR